jgi:DNA-binding MarR family transcriptional regulator
MPQRESLRTLRDGLSAGQARLLGYLVNRCKDGRELTQREIEHAMGYSSASSELFYRLESLIAEGFLQKRRIAADGQFSYRLTRDCAEIGEV